MKKVQFSAKMMQNLAYLSKNLLATPPIKVPRLTSMGDEIKSIQELADVMGVDYKVAAAYAIQSDSDLKEDAISVLAGDPFSKTISSYAYEIAQKVIVERKAIRIVRDSNGARYFDLPVGSIIVADGQKPLDAITAAPNDVPGYDKVVDKQGRAYYIGKEQNRWVVRSGASKEIIYQTSVADGEQESLYWLNTQLGGQSSGKKSMEETETKRQFTTLAVEKLGKRGHAFRNKNGSYSYPISTVADLKNAIQAFGRAAPEDRERLKAFIKKRARQLGEEALIPEGWKTGEPVDIETKIKHDRSSLDRSPNKNWVEVSGQLPGYIREIAHALIRDHGFTISHAIATAVNRCKKWSAGIGNVNADTRAKAAAAVAQWEKLKATNKARMLAKRASK